MAKSAAPSFNPVIGTATTPLVAGGGGAGVRSWPEVLNVRVPDARVVVVPTPAASSLLGRVTVYDHALVPVSVKFTAITWSTPSESMTWMGVEKLPEAAPTVEAAS